MIETSLDKIKKVVKCREFTNFWEAFQYMLDAGYTELEALKIGLELFNGDIWGNVINTSWKTSSIEVTLNGDTIHSSSSTYLVGNIAVDDLIVEMFLMTKEGNRVYQPIYKSYTETRKYCEIPELESHIKSIRFKLTTELAINLFKHHVKQLN
jgi:hypothetical protein